VFAAGLVIRDLSTAVSSWRAEGNLSDFLVSDKVVAIAGIDTRRLTRILREKGAQNGAVLAGSDDADQALEAARAFPGLAGMDLAKVVTTAKPYEWSEGRWQAGGGFGKGAAPRFHVVAYDYGVKRNILRMLVDRGCRVTVLPAQTPATDALALGPDGCSCRTVRATRNPATTPYALSGKSSTPGFRPSGSASATSLWDSRPELGP